MPLRGETIGRAYVKILADGSGFPDSVRDMFDKNQGAFQTMGEEDSRAYTQGFLDQSDDLDEDFVNRLRLGLKRQAGKFDAAGQQMAGDLFDPLDEELEQRAGNIGKQMALDMRDGFRKSGGDPNFLDDFVEGFAGNLEKATRTVEEQDKKILAMTKAQEKRLVEIERNGSNERLAIRKAEFEAGVHRIEAEVIQANEDERRQKKAHDAQQQIFRDEQAEIRKTVTEFKNLTRQIKAYHRSTDQSFAARRQFLKDLELLDTKLRSLSETTKTYDRDHKNLRNTLRNTHPFLSRTAALFDRLGDGMGRAFGKGSRNNFFNFMGAVVGGLTSLGGIPFRIAEKFFSVFTSLSGAFTDAGGGMKGLVAVAGKVTTGLASAAAGGAALLVVLGLVAAVAGVVSSALLTLAGAAVAMAGSLTFALGGAIAVVAGALVPLIAAIGVGILAFKNMDKDTTKVFKSIGKDFKKLGEEASANIFDHPIEQAKAFKGAIEGLGKITGPVSKALGGLLDEFTDSLESPEFKNFEVFLGRTLPDMVTALGHIFGNLGEAFIGIFRAIAPSTQEFLDWVDEVTQKFADWTNSTKGKHEIKDFLDEAKESAIAVGDALGSIIGLIGDLLGLGKDSGDDLFTSIADEVDRWRASLAKAKEDGTIQKWFEDAKKTATEIGGMVKALGKFIEKLDTPENRELVRQIADAFIKTVDIIAAAAPKLEKIFKIVGGPVIILIANFGLLLKAWEKVGEAIKWVYNHVIKPVWVLMLEAFAAVLDAVGSLFDVLGHVPGFGWAKNLAGDLHDAADKADGLAASIKNIPDANIHVNGPSAAELSHIEGLFNILTRDRTVTIHANLTGYPGPTTGGQDPQGKTVANGQKVVNLTVHMNTPTVDTQAVTAELMNRLAAAAYI